MSKKQKTAAAVKAEAPKRQRDYSLDLLRIIATFSVISIHFLMNTKFYDEPIKSKGMYSMTLLRTFMGICVPIFIVLSGYLMRKKEFSKKYYTGIKKTLFIYLIACIATLIFKAAYFGETFTFLDSLLSILGFNAAYYSWYIEMYIGLFLLIPFLNAAYNGMKDKTAKKAIVITTFCLMILPNVLNIYNFRLEGWWDTPLLSKEYDPIVPSWWRGAYPLAYYFLGCYLSEFKPKMNRALNIALLAAAGFVFSGFNYYRSTTGTFVKGAWNDWYSLQDYVLTLLVFILVSNFDLSKAPKAVQNTLKFVSDLCLGIYLTAGIFDQIFYAPVIEKYPVITDRFGSFFKTVPLVFLCALASSFVINLLYALVMLAAGKIKKK